MASVQPDPGDEDITDPDNGPIAFKLAYYDSYNEKSAGEFTFYLKDDSHYTILYSDYFPGYSVPGFSYRFAADVGTEFTVDTADGAAVPASKTVNVELYHEGYDHAIDTKAGLLHIADDMDGTFILAADVDTGNSNGNYWNPLAGQTATTYPLLAGSMETTRRFRVCTRCTAREPPISVLWPSTRARFRT